MSTEPDLEFDSTLPTELRGIETVLQQFTPSATAVNRDELMYCAGWEAARAQNSGSRTNLRIWQTAATALAASLLLVMLQTGTKENQNSTILDPEPVVAVTEPEASTSQPEHPRPRYVQTTYLRSTAPLLVMRSRALNQDFGELPVHSYSGSTTPATVTTNLKLLKEFLPRS